jgi:hypothetical protein
MTQHQPHRTVSDTKLLVTRFAASPTHGHLSAAQGSSTTVSRSDNRLIQHFDSSAHGLAPKTALNWSFPHQNHHPHCAARRGGGAAAQQPAAHAGSAQHVLGPRCGHGERLRDGAGGAAGAVQLRGRRRSGSHGGARYVCVWSQKHGPRGIAWAPGYTQYRPNWRSLVVHLGVLVCWCMNLYYVPNGTQVRAWVPAAAAPSPPLRGVGASGRMVAPEEVHYPTPFPTPPTHPHPRPLHAPRGSTQRAS